MCSKAEEKKIRISLKYLFPGFSFFPFPLFLPFGQIFFLSLIHISLYADLSRMTDAVLIVHTFPCLTVDAAVGGSFFHLIGVRALSSLLEAVAAGLRRPLRAVSAHGDLIQVTVVILVVGTGLYGTCLLYTSR